MPYLFIEDFKNGLDVRKSPTTAPPGTLLELENAHITRGGEIEKRQAFAVLSQLPPGQVKGMAGAPGVLWLFGQDPLPAGFEFNTTGNAEGLNVVYQQLGLPTGITEAELVRITSVEFWGDKPFVVAEWRTEQEKPDIIADPPDPDDGTNPGATLEARLVTLGFSLARTVSTGAGVAGQQSVIVDSSKGAVTYTWNPIPPQPVNYSGAPLAYTEPGSTPDTVNVMYADFATEGTRTTNLYVDVTDIDGASIRLSYQVSVTYVAPPDGGGGGGGGFDPDPPPVVQPK